MRLSIRPFAWARLAALALISCFVLAQPPASQAADPLPTIRLGTGGASGLYFPAGNTIQDLALGRLTVEVIKTGAAQDNLERLARGELDAAFTQLDSVRYYKLRKPDVAAQYEVVATLYDEAQHLLCRRQNGPKSLNDLLTNKKFQGKKIAVGAPLSGSEGSWFVWATQIKGAFENVAAVPMDDREAALKLTDPNEDLVCMLVTSAIGTANMKSFDVDVGDALHLVPLQHDLIPGLLDLDNKPMYSVGTIPEGSYKKIQDDVWGSDDVATVTTKAQIVVSKKFKQVNPVAYRAFLEAVQKSRGAILAAAKPKSS